MIILNELSEEIVKEEHVCFYTEAKDSFEKIRLMEVILLTLKHPTAPEHAFIQKYDIRHVDDFKRIQKSAASTILLEAAQKNSLRIEKLKNKKEEK